MNKEAKISIIGFGNVGSHLSKALVNNGFTIHQIYNRTKIDPSKFTGSQNVNVINDIELLDCHANVFLFCLKDDALAPLLTKTQFTDQLLLHTAGSLDLEVFQNKSKNYGVFYPLQTFSKERNINFHEIPICVEANNSSALNNLKDLASKLSDKVYAMNSEQRKYLHLAAVFAANYTNAMYGIAQEIAEAKNIPFEILRPLIKETADKVMEFLPKAAQTGPAIRNDEAIMNSHIKLLDEELKLEIYHLLAHYIKQKR